MPEDQQEPRLRLYVGRLHFGNFAWDGPSHSLCMSWIAESEVENVYFVRIVAIGFHWPPLRVVDSFRMFEEEEGEGS